MASVPKVQVNAFLVLLGTRVLLRFALIDEHLFAFFRKNAVASPVWCLACATVGPNSVDAFGVCITTRLLGDAFVVVFALLAVTREARAASARVGAQVILTHGVLVTRIVRCTFVDICVEQASFSIYMY